MTWTRTRGTGPAEVCPQSPRPVLVEDRPLSPLELQALSLRPDLGAATDAAWQADPAFAPLSTREREVLAMLAQATRVPAIATHLHISQHTVRNHLKAIFAKLGVRSQSALIERVHEAGRG